jgi:phosphate:Na+ symporter
MTFPAAVAIMLGAELGTCADTLIASLGRRRAALKTGLFHLTFNLAAVLLGLLLIGPFTQAVERVTADLTQPVVVARARPIPSPARRAESGGRPARFGPWRARLFL